MAEYSSNEMACDSSAEETLRRYLTLGIGCSIPSSAGSPEEVFVYPDFYFECGSENEFDHLFETNNSLRFTCFSTLSVPPTANSNSEVFADQPQVDIGTDFRWSSYANEQCYTFKPTSSQ